MGKFIAAPQQSLFSKPSPTKPLPNKPHTSREAKERVSEFESEMNDRIVEAHRQAPNGLTTEELTNITGIPIQSTSASIKGLMKAKRLHRRMIRFDVDRGEPIYVTRPNRSGRNAIVNFFGSGGVS